MHTKGILVGLILMIGGSLFPSLAKPAEDRLQLQVMLAAHPDAPTPVEVVEQWNFSSPPPTPGLGAENPLFAWYLLPHRAEGDFASRL
jgi:hypothetical protein